MNVQKNLLFLPVTLLSAVLPINADTIYKTDGTQLEDVTIVNESLWEVVYKEGRKESRIASDQVLRVEFSAMPGLLDDALGSISEGDVRSAISYLEEYVAGQLERPSERRYKWAPAYAAWKLIQLRKEIADLRSVRSSAQILTKNFPESRYVPGAYLLKAQSEWLMGDGNKAQATLEILGQIITKDGLSQRWDLERRLAEARVNTTSSAEAMRAAIAVIQRDAGAKFPTVRSRARLVEGESYLSEAEGTNDGTQASRLRDRARRVFEGIVGDDATDDETLAGAHAGIGDCMFFAGAETGEEGTLRQALMNYLRVVSLHRQQSQYVSKSLYFALRCFELLEDKVRMRDMKRELLLFYPNSIWAKRREVTRGG